MVLAFLLSFLISPFSVYYYITLVYFFSIHPNVDTEDIEETTDETVATESTGTETATVTPAPTVPQKTAAETEAEKKKAHEEAEAKRKAEWEEKKQKREEEEMFKWEEATSVSDEELVSKSLKTIGDDVERITRRNMKLCVNEYLQTVAMDDLKFARQILHPRKNMINCFHYINRKALEYLKKEMSDNDEQPNREGFGGDVPDELCYQWAVEYFYDMGCKEDKKEGEEDFVPQPYKSSYTSPKKKAAKKETKKQEKPKSQPDQQQLLFETQQMSFADEIKTAKAG